MDDFLVVCVVVVVVVVYLVATFGCCVHIAAVVRGLAVEACDECEPTDFIYFSSVSTL